MTHISFAIITCKLPSMRMYKKVKRLGIWDPTDIDFFIWFLLPTFATVALCRNHESESIL